MNLQAALIFYLLFVIVVFLSSVKFGITKWSSLVLALLLGMLILSLLFPISSVERIMTNNPYLYVYSVLQIITIFIILWYVFYSIYNDRNCLIRVYSC